MLRTDFIIQPLLEHYAKSQSTIDIIKQIKSDYEDKNSINKLLANEVETNHMGLGISLNSVFITRSILALKNECKTTDIPYLYRDLTNPDSWVPLSKLEEYILTKKGQFEEGVSSQDGIIFGYDTDWAKKFYDMIPNAKEGTIFYKNKIVGGEPRSEFFSLMHLLFGTDMRDVLSQLVSPNGVGSGTTSQVAEQCFGVLLAGSNANVRQYRLRKTRISRTMSTGHIMVYKVSLNNKFEHKMQKEGFDFYRIFDPCYDLKDITSDWRKCFYETNCFDEHAQPIQLFNIQKLIITSEIKPNGDFYFIATLKTSNNETNQICEEEKDITDYVNLKLKK